MPFLAAAFPAFLIFTVLAWALAANFVYVARTPKLRLISTPSSPAALYALAWLVFDFGLVAAVAAWDTELVTAGKLAFLLFVPLVVLVYFASREG